MPFPYVPYPFNAVALGPSPDWVIGFESEMPRAEALETYAKMCAARVSACDGRYVEGEWAAGEAGDESEDGTSEFWSTVVGASGVF